MVHCCCMKLITKSANKLYQSHSDKSVVCLGKFAGNQNFKLDNQKIKITKRILILNTPTFIVIVPTNIYMSNKLKK